MKDKCNVDLRVIDAISICDLLNVSSKGEYLKII